MSDKRITWHVEENKRGISAFNADGEELRWLQLERVGRHMHWFWYQNEDIRMSPSCLQEVRDKQKEVYVERGSQ